MNDAQRKSKLVFVFSIFVLWDFFELKVPVIGFYWLARSLNWKTPLHIDVYALVVVIAARVHDSTLSTPAQCVRVCAGAQKEWLVYCKLWNTDTCVLYSDLEFCFFSFSFSFSNSNGNPFGWCALHYRSEASTNVRATYMNRIKYDQ